jgi:glycosyltransferase involved in cell wall biosynthesis
VTSQLTFTGELAPDEVATTLDESHCVALTSRHEGLSLSATEALVRGKPLILSKETGHASYSEVASAPHVLLVAPDVTEITSGLREFVGRRDEILEAANASAPVLANLFSWERVGRAHLAHYERLLRHDR